MDRVDELVLVESGAVVDIRGEEEDEGRRCKVSHQVFVVFFFSFSSRLRHSFSSEVEI